MVPDMFVPKRRCFVGFFRGLPPTGVVSSRANDQCLRQYLTTWIIPVSTVPETNILAPENGWLEDDRFLLGLTSWQVLLLLVSGSVDVVGNYGATRRIIPFSKWLVTPSHKPFRSFGRGITPVRGLTITMVINPLLNGMILQVWCQMVWPKNHPTISSLLHRLDLFYRSSNLLEAGSVISWSASWWWQPSLKSMLWNSYIDHFSILGVKKYHPNCERNHLWKNNLYWSIGNSLPPFQKWCWTFWMIFTLLVRKSHG